MDIHPRLPGHRVVRPARRGAAWLALICLLTAVAPFRAALSEDPEKEAPAPTPPARPEEVLRWFQDAPCSRLKLVLAPEEEAKLEKEPKAYVHASLQEGSKVLLPDVGLKLKGSVGSFQGLDDKPGFTIKVDKWQKDQEFHGLTKFHLNNAAQDSTFLAEFLGYEVFRTAGVPAPLVSHARVSLNGRDLGLYALKESYDKRFVTSHFADAGGMLFDGGFCQDIDVDLEQDAGPKAGEEGGLKSLLAACKEPAPLVRRERLEAVLDVDEFLTFMALERMLCHWDGYCMNRNNYRIYIPTNGRTLFLPHGMDQLLGDARVSVFDDPVSIVANAVLDNAEWAKAYRKRVAELLPILAASDRLDKRLDAQLARLKPLLAGAPSSPSGVATLKSRIDQRVKNLKAQLAQPALKAVEFDKGEAFRINSWRPVSQAGEATLTQVAMGNERVLRVQAGDPAGSVGSWRSRVLLPPGSYRFEASARSESMVPMAGPPAGGALIAVSVAGDGPGLDGTEKRGWKPLSLDFVVADVPTNVEFAVELRALSGTANFKLASLRIVRTD